MPSDRDYAICLESADGKHQPTIALWQDAELIAIGYVTLECSECHQTTGYPVVDFVDVDW